MKKKNTYSVLFNQPKYKAAKGRPQLLRITINHTQTKVDFGHQTTDYYKKGGWVRIDENTFIRNKDTGEKLTITRAENIPISPARHDFDTTKDWLYFSLYFPPLPEKTVAIDLIEKENGDPTDFNYYDIQLSKTEAIELL
jgi:hypothetical protein